MRHHRSPRLARTAGSAGLGVEPRSEASAGIVAARAGIGPRTASLPRKSASAQPALLLGSAFHVPGAAARVQAVGARFRAVEATRYVEWMSHETEVASLVAAPDCKPKTGSNDDDHL